jgi:YjbE family integral membrane protein
MDITTFLSALLAIVVIDLVLAGDNAIVIALAARSLPRELQRRAILWGTVGAIGVRCAMTLVVVWLLAIPGLMAVGGALLVWIAWRLLLPEQGEHGAEAGHATSTTNFWGAMRTIVVADALMGLDNVLAVAGAAHGSYLLVVLGLAISVPVMVWGSTLVLRWVERYPAIVYLGAAVLCATAVRMVQGEPLLKPWFAQWPLLSALLWLTVPALLWAAVVHNHRRLASRIHARLSADAARRPGAQGSTASTAGPQHTTGEPDGRAVRSTTPTTPATPGRSSETTDAYARSAAFGAVPPAALLGAGGLAPLPAYPALAMAAGTPGALLPSTAAAAAGAASGSPAGMNTDVSATSTRPYPDAQSTTTTGETVLNVLVPIDGAGNALEAVRHVIREYQRDHQLRVHLLNVQAPLMRHASRWLPRAIRRQFHEEQAQGALKQSEALLTEAGVPYESHWRVGDRAREICAAAEELRAHHLVMGTARKSSLTRMLEDSVTGAVLERTQVPVEVVVGSTVSRLERWGVPVGVGATLSGLAWVALD